MRVAAASARRRLLGRSLVNLAGQSVADLQAILGSEVPAYRARQLLEGVMRGQQVDEITSLPTAVRRQLADNLGAVTGWGRVLRCQQSRLDGTTKLLVGLDDAATGVPLAKSVEAVVIPMAGARSGTLCASSQVGCSLACRFCHTGTQKMDGQLSASQIVGQVILASRELARLGPPSPPVIRNVVFMGQGEPLLNWRNVSAAIEMLTSPTGLAIPRRRITVSTVGITPHIPSVADRGVRLAVSLHAAEEDVRTSIMPSNRQFPLRQLHEACAEYLKRAADLHSHESDDDDEDDDEDDAGPRRAVRTQPSSHPSRHPRLPEPRLQSAYSSSSSSSSSDRRGLELLQRGSGSEVVSRSSTSRMFHRHWSRISFEVTLLAGVNDSDRAADALAQWCHDLGLASCHVNLIPFNPWPGSGLVASSRERLAAFLTRLRNAQVSATIRATRGQDILAACGQLKSATPPKPAPERVELGDGV